MKNLHLYLLFILLSPLCLKAQGLILDDAAYQELPKAHTKGQKSSTKVDANKVDLKPFCPSPQNQGEISSCVGFSLGYGAMTILYAIKHKLGGKQEEIDRHAFSAMYLYNQVKENKKCASGATFHEALLFLQEKGNHLFSRYDKNLADCQRKPTTGEEQFAKKYRIPDFERLFDAKAKDNEKINKVKAYLNQKKPVVVGMEILENFKNVTAKDKYWYPNLGNTNYGGGHAMVVVGFNDKKKAFELMNSYGTKWGKNGFCWIKYGDFAKYCRYAAVISPSNEKLIYLKHYKVKIALSKPELQADGLLSPIKTGKRFTTQQSITKGSYLQLLVEGLNPELNLYAFSVDANNEVNIHWPRAEEIKKQEDFIIPEEKKALVFEKKGIEQLVVLLSPDPIKNFKEIVDNLKSAALENQLKQGFGHEFYLADAKIEGNQIIIDKFTYQDNVWGILLRLEVK